METDGDTYYRILNVERIPEANTKTISSVSASCFSNSHLKERSEAWRIHADTWLTTNRVVHNEKIQDPSLHEPIRRKAPSLTRIEYLHPDKVRVSQSLNLEINKRDKLSTMRADYVNWDKQPIKKIIDTVQCMNTFSASHVGEGFRGCILKPYFGNQELFSIVRKLNPYISTTHLDHRNCSRETFSTR